MLECWSISSLSDYWYICGQSKILEPWYKFNYCLIGAEKLWWYRRLWPRHVDINSGTCVFFLSLTETKKINFRQLTHFLLPILHVSRHETCLCTRNGLPSKNPKITDNWLRTFVTSFPTSYGKTLDWVWTSAEDMFCVYTVLHPVMNTVWTLAEQGLYSTTHFLSPFRQQQSLKNQRVRY